MFIESKTFILRENLNSNITLLEKKKVYKAYLEKIIKNLNLGKVRKLSRSNIKDTLSKGEQQKIQLARLLLKEYSLILLDECFSAFDEVIKKTVISELKKRSKNSIIIIISHDPEIIKGFDKTLFILKKIRIR